MQLTNNHLTIKTAADITAICEPLFQHTQITEFFYIRIFNDGSTIAFYNNPEWSKYIIEKKLYLTNLSPQIIHKRTHIHRLEHTDFSPQIITDYLDKFKLNNVIQLNKHYNNYWELCGFATKNSSYKIIEYYYNNLDLLQLFCSYFRDKAAKLIKLHEKQENKVILPEYSQNKHLLHFNQYQQIDKYKIQQILLKELNSSKFSFDHTKNNSLLSVREIDCLHYLVKGRSAIETALLLNISPKTVEAYLNAAKIKLNCNSRSELFDTIWKSDLIDLFKIQDI